MGLPCVQKCPSQPSHQRTNFDSEKRKHCRPLRKRYYLVAFFPRSKESIRAESILNDSPIVDIQIVDCSVDLSHLQSWQRFFCLTQHIISGDPTFRRSGQKHVNLVRWRAPHPANTGLLKRTNSDTVGFFQFATPLPPDERVPTTPKVEFPPGIQSPPSPQPPMPMGRSLVSAVLPTL